MPDDSPRRACPLLVTPANDTDVVVIGAGAAGLAASLHLARRGVRVIALDGRERAGGRVMWEAVGSVDEPAELGAEFVHGAAPQTSALMSEAGLRQVGTGSESWTCGVDGVLRADGDDDFDPGDLFDLVRSLETDESVEKFLARFERDPRQRLQARRARAFVEGFEAADPALASARSIAEELRSGVDSTSSRPVGGYAPLFTYLAARCADTGVDVRLRTVAERIDWRRGAVTVTARDASGGFPLCARCVVVTVPVGVLQQRVGAQPLEFVPPLSDEKRAALRGLEMGHVVRVTLAFRTPFWERLAGGRYRDAAFFRCEVGTFAAFWTQLPFRGRTVVAWSGGPRAAAMDGMTAGERIALARDELGALLDADDATRSAFEAGVTHDWSTDPLACGAYSYVVTGAGEARAVLGSPVAQTVFFAGEATAVDGQGGTVGGAFDTGARAAREVLAALDRADATPPSAT